jgi:hypothetical protein
MTETTMPERFWIIGGEFRDTSFAELVAGTERLLGPYANRDAALRAWRGLADETKSLCTARFTVVAEAGTRAAH